MSGAKITPLVAAFLAREKNDEDTIVKAFTDAFLADDAETAMRPQFEELAIATAMMYAKSGAGMGNRPAKIKPGREQAVLDVIMENAYSGESLQMSLSRLAKAAGVIGFPCLNAFFASATYKIYPHLTEKSYDGRKPSRANRDGQWRGDAHAGTGRGGRGAEEEIGRSGRSR